MVDCSRTFKLKSRYKFIFRNKKQLNILSLKSIEKYYKVSSDAVLHLAALSGLCLFMIIKLVKVLI